MGSGCCGWDSPQRRVGGISGGSVLCAKQTGCTDRGRKPFGQRGIAGTVERGCKAKGCDDQFDGSQLEQRRKNVGPDASGCSKPSVGEQDQSCEEESKRTRNGKATNNDECQAYRQNHGQEG